MAKAEMRRILRYLGHMIAISVIAGAVGAVIVAIFSTILDLIIEATPHLLPRAPFLLPIIGALLVGALIIRWVPGAGGEGIPSYIFSVNRKWGRYSAAATALKFPATFITLGFYGSGGLVGPLARMCSGVTSAIMGKLTRPLRLHKEIDLRTAAICGVSGAVSAIFHSPLGGGIFAAEILRKETMRYSDLFPSIFSGIIALIVSTVFLRQEPIFSINAPAEPMSTSLIPWLLLVAVISGSIGILFITVFEYTSKILMKIPSGQPARALVSSVIVSLIWFFKSGRLLNISMPLYHQITTGKLSVLTSPGGVLEYVGLSLVIILILKIIATSCTVGSGLSGGFTGPCIILGVGSGALIYSFMGLSTADPAYFGFMACGMAAMLAAVINTPIAAMIITAKLFGHNYIIPAVIGGILSFLLYKGKFLYELTMPPEGDTSEADQ